MIALTLYTCLHRVPQFVLRTPIQDRKRCSLCCKWCWEQRGKILSRVRARGLHTPRPTLHCVRAGSWRAWVTSRQLCVLPESYMSHPCAPSFNIDLNDKGKYAIKTLLSSRVLHLPWFLRWGNSIRLCIRTLHPLAEHSSSFSYLSIKALSIALSPPLIHILRSLSPTVTTTLLWPHIVI